MKSVFKAILAVLTAYTLTLSTNAQPTPGPEHDHLKKLAGTWTTKTRVGDEVSEGTATYKMELGGLWLVGTFTGSMGGQPFEGRAFDGFDPAKKKYVSVWVDSMSTHPLFFEGTYDKAKKTLTATGEGFDPDGNRVKYKSVTHMPDDDHQKFTLYMIDSEGKEQQLVVIDYTRKK